MIIVEIGCGKILMATQEITDAQESGGISYPVKPASLGTSLQWERMPILLESEADEAE